MSNTLKAERQHWHVDLNEHVSHLPPYVTAEYQTPIDSEGITPVRIQPEGDSSMYGFEVSAPDEAGAVTLAATKTYESDLLHKPVTAYATLKTYDPADYDQSESYLDPRTDALSDARALVYEWGRGGLDQAMGSALLFAQENEFKDDQLFTEGPADTFAPVDNPRPLETIQTERDWERDAEIFGRNGYRIPQPEGMNHARAIGQYEDDPEVEAGQFYGVTVREAHIGDQPDAKFPPVYVVEGVKAWLDKETNKVEHETVTLDVRGNQSAGMQVADSIADEPDLHTRLASMETRAHDTAQRMQGSTIPLLGTDPTANLGLNLRYEGLFETGFPDPEPAQEITSTNDDYTRIIGAAAYDMPLENGQGYAFRARHLPAIEERHDGAGVDVMAVEAVKFWDDHGERQEAATTLNIYHQFDDRAAQDEVDVYVDLAERDGIQAAMTRAAAMADVQYRTNINHTADDLGINLNPDVQYGEMFSAGPADPFLSEREIVQLTADFSQDTPAQHHLLWDVVNNRDARGASLGHSVIAVDAEADHRLTDLEDADQVTVYEVAQFGTAKDAQTYASSVEQYLHKRGLATEGDNIQPTIGFVTALQAENSLEGHTQTLERDSIQDLATGNWHLETPTDASFQPITLGASPDITTPQPDLDF